jgi:hypothetical protein
VKTRRRVAVVLWLVLACLVWSVVFDRILVLAGRRYSYAATVAARQGNTYVRIDDWMRPAVARGVRVASLAGLSVAIVGLAGIAVASRFERRP